MRGATRAAAHGLAGELVALLRDPSRPSAASVLAGARGWVDTANRPIADAPEDLSVVDVRIGFVTEGLFGTGGLALADAMCASEASAAGHPGSFLAFLANAGNGPEARFPTGAAWHRVDGVKWATYAQLTAASGYLSSFMTVYPSGARSDGHGAWVGTATANCASWTSTTENAPQSNPGATNVAKFRSGFSMFLCGLGERLICLQE